MKHETILSTIGRTPVVRLNRMGPRDVNVFMKLESFNPMGSVKDRMALATIEAAEQSGQLRPGQTADRGRSYTYRSVITSIQVSMASRIAKSTALEPRSLANPDK